MTYKNSSFFFLLLPSFASAVVSLFFSFNFSISLETNFRRPKNVRKKKVGSRISRDHTTAHTTRTFLNSKKNIIYIYIDCSIRYIFFTRAQNRWGEFSRSRVSITTLVIQFLQLGETNKTIECPVRMKAGLVSDSQSPQLLTKNVCEGGRKGDGKLFFLDFSTSTLLTEKGNVTIVTWNNLLIVDAGRFTTRQTSNGQQRTAIRVELWFASKFVCLVLQKKKLETDVNRP